MEAPSGERLRGKADMVFVAGKTVWSMSERFKVDLDHARRYTSAQLYLTLLTVLKLSQIVVQILDTAF